LKEGETMTQLGESEKRNRILIAAVKVFSRKGFHETKVDEIAQLADVGKGTVYEYFSSKAELFQEMFRSGLQLYQEKIEREIKKGISSRDKLSRIARFHIKFMVQYKDLARVTMNEHAHFDEGFHSWVIEKRAKKLKILQGIIEEGIAAGEFREIDSDAAAQTFMGCLGALFSPIVFSDDKIKHDDLVEPVIDILFNGILKQRD
jgi:AcrR family transcriptional regulator